MLKFVILLGPSLEWFYSGCYNSDFSVIQVSPDSSEAAVFSDRRDADMVVPILEAHGFGPVHTRCLEVNPF